MIILFVYAIIILSFILTVFNNPRYKSGSRSGSKDISLDDLNILPDVVSMLPFVTNVTGEKPKYNRHHGQRKLFLAEMQLLNTCITAKRETQDDRPILFVYAGAAPCMHMGYLSELFPEVTFLLIDPNEFLIYYKDKVHYDLADSGKVVYFESHGYSGYKIQSQKKIQGIDGNIYDKKLLKMYDSNDQILDHIIQENTPKIYIIENYMTIPLAESLKNNHYYTIFMSDIRTNSRDNSIGEPQELDVLWNNSQMFNWASVMQPDCLCHKHRVQYLNIPRGPVADYMTEDLEYSKSLGIDFLKNFDRCQFVYFSGQAYLQAWISKGSSETRLVSFKMPKNYDPDFIPKLEEIPEKGFCPDPNAIPGPGRYIAFPDDYVPQDETPGTMPDIPFSMQYYDMVKYDQQMLFHNRTNKTTRRFENPYAGNGIDHCFDCCLEASIWDRYSALIHKVDVKKEMLNLHKHLGSKNGFVNDINSIINLHKKVEQSKHMAKSSNPDFVKDRFKK